MGDKPTYTITADVEHFHGIAQTPRVFHEIAREEIDRLTAADLAEWDEPELRHRLSRVAGMLAVLLDRPVESGFTTEELVKIGECITDRMSHFAEPTAPAYATFAALRETWKTVLRAQAGREADDEPAEGEE